jgi:hypothetical protein
VKGRQQEKKNYCEGACGHRAVKGRQQEKKFIVKLLVAMWRSEISECILSPQAYLH